MRAAVLRHAGSDIELLDVYTPEPQAGQILVRVDACAICRTDLHVIDDELKGVKYPIIPGHEIVGSVVDLGRGVERFSLGDRVGIPWLGHTCGTCRYCLHGQENLCDHAAFTGHSTNGGFAEFTVADAEYCFAIADTYDACEAAPLLCAGLIGYRTLKFAGEGIQRLGIYGFGAAAHIVAQVATFRGLEVFAFTRPGDREAQAFASDLGACWAGGSDTKPPQELDAALIFAPVGALV
ncbi:MAG: alcohol dehydrogenase catalytic domain-containing protein, partial [Hyphomicrobiaceae bacterium]